MSDFAIGAGFIDTAWSPSNVIVNPGTVELELNSDNARGKNYTGAEIKTNQEYHYGLYEVTMTPTGLDGALSSFFVYTGPPFGDPVSEIDIEFLGSSNRKVLLTLHTPEGSDGELIDLGFDAAAGEHTYAFDWGPDSVRWYVDGVLVREVVDADIGIPSEPGQIHMSIWTGANSFTGTPSGNFSTTAEYNSVSFTPRTAPVALNDRVDIDVGETVLVDVLANDSAMTGSLVASSVTIDTPPANGIVTVTASGQVEYTPNPGFRGVDTFSYTVSDGSELSNSGDVQMVVGVPILETFSVDAGVFGYADDAFRGTAEPGFADGVAADGVLRVALGGGSTKSTITDISGGWSADFTTQAGQSGTLALRYRLELTENLDAGEFAEVLIAVDGVEQSLLRIDATDSDTETLDSGFVDVVVDLGQLAPGNHTLTLGGYLNQRTRSNESATVEFDSVDLTLSAASPADDDGNLALTTADAFIDGTEALAVTFDVTGIDADATATVTVSDGATDVTGVLASDGALVLDLSALADGPLTTSVTASDGTDSVTIPGPGLTLVPAGGDDDGNLVLTAPDTSIDGTEKTAVTFDVTGIDADATATVTVSDGATDVTGVLASDGSLVLDLTPLADGPLTTSVTATDANANTTTTQGPALALSSTAPQLPLISSDFSGGAGVFGYADDAFRGTAEPG
ncbi:MAG: family 16 glycosylhydrolase, partial [Pseudomonadota bacterium]